MKGLTKRWDDFVAVDDVSVTVPDGSLTALLGPSGSGKSTLLRLIAGLEAPDAGRVAIEGRDVTAVPPQARDIGFVFQHYAAFKHMTVRANVAFGLTVRRRPKREIAARVDELLQIVGLEGHHERYPARAVRRPAPAHGAGPRAGGRAEGAAARRAVRGAGREGARRSCAPWLRRLHDEAAVTTVLVTHDQEEAMDVADRIAVLCEGRLEQVGSPRELYDRPASDFVMEFIGPVTRLGGRPVRPHDVVLSTRPQARRPAGHRPARRAARLRGARRARQRRRRARGRPADARRGRRPRPRPRRRGLACGRSSSGPGPGRRRRGPPRRRRDAAASPSGAGLVVSP